jgi:hypothetical protein
MAIQATVSVGVPMCPSRTSQLCPTSTRFIPRRVPVSRRPNARARRGRGCVVASMFSDKYIKHEIRRGHKDTIDVRFEVSN